MPDTISAPEPSEGVKSSPYLMECLAVGVDLEDDDAGAVGLGPPERALEQVGDDGVDGPLDLDDLHVAIAGLGHLDPGRARPRRRGPQQGHGQQGQEGEKRAAQGGLLA